MTSLSSVLIPTPVNGLKKEISGESERSEACENERGALPPGVQSRARFSSPRLYFAGTLNDVRQNSRSVNRP